MTRCLRDDWAQWGNHLAEKQRIEEDAEEHATQHVGAVVRHQHIRDGGLLKAQLLPAPQKVVALACTAALDSGNGWWSERSEQCKVSGHASLMV